VIRIRAASVSERFRVRRLCILPSKARRSSLRPRAARACRSGYNCRGGWLVPSEGRAVLRRMSPWCWVGAASLLAGCAATGQRAQPLPQQTAPPTAGIVFVADGSGDLHQVADALAGLAQESRLPLRVERVRWSHGSGAVFLDLYDGEHQRTQGQTLAQQILTYRQSNPHGRICLVGYSSGAAVVLAAAESLPAGTVDRMVLLAPAVAARRDLRPALLCCREGIDNYCSERDAVCLALTATGTADGVGLAIAGRTGFVPAGDTGQDRVLYQRLRQHTWAGPAQWSGHDGGHFACSHRDFLSQQIMPILTGR